MPTKSVSLVAQQNVRQHNKLAVAVSSEVAVSSKKIAVSGSKTYPQVKVKVKTISSKAIYKIRVAAGSSAIKAISSRAFSQVKVKASIQTQAVHKVRANNSTLNCLMHTDLDKAAPDVTLSPRSSSPFPSPVNTGPSAPDQYQYPGTPFQVLNPSYTQRPLPEPASTPRQLPKTPPPPVVAFSPGTEAVSRSFDVPK
ncbi:high molecular weight glutenin subunit [Alternaria alternata]|nr:high molecular weight glutenin subunit [Alternaria alternata]